MKVSQKEIYDYLINRGLSRNHALGMLANIKAESNFDASAEGDNGASYGLFQHNLSRRDSLVKYINDNYENKDWKTNWKGQIDYALTEEDTKKYISKSFNNPQEASKWFTINWERPANAKQKAEERLNYFGDEFVEDKKIEFKDLEGKEITIDKEKYLINPTGQIDGKDVIIKKSDFENQELKNVFNPIEREGYTKDNFVKDINDGKFIYDKSSEYNTSTIGVFDPEEFKKEQEILSKEHEQYGYEKVVWDQLSSEQKENIRNQFNVFKTPDPLPVKTEKEIEQEAIEEQKQETQELIESTATQAVDKDKDGIPDYIDIDGGTGTDKSLVEEKKPELTNLQKAGQVGKTLLEGAESVLDYIGGPGAIVSYIMGKEGLKEAMKEVKPQASAELSPMFMQHLRQSRELAKKGFHPDQARKIRKGIDAAYQKGLDDAVRGTGGDRAKYLAQSGILDAKRSSALLDFAAKDAELQKSNADKYEKIMMFKENFDITQTEKERTEDMERQLAKKKAATEFTSAAFSNVISGLGRSNSNSAIIEQMMNRYTGGTGGKGFFNQLDNK